MEQKFMTVGKARVIGAMSIFGTNGLFVRFIPMPSSIIACCRGAIGTVFLLLLCLLQYIPAGLFLAWSYARCNTIVAPVLIHMTVNAMGLYILR